MQPFLKLWLALGLCLPVAAEEILKVRFYSEPADAAVYMVDTTDHFLGIADQPLRLEPKLFQQNKDGVFFRFERPGFASRTTLDPVPRRRLEHLGDDYRYPPRSLGPIQLEPLDDWNSRIIQAGLSLQRWKWWLLAALLLLPLLRFRRRRAELPGSPAALALGDYHLFEQIGQGGMAEVYRARRPEAGEDDSVAIKMMHLELAQAQDAAERFRREVRAHLALVHPNLPTLIDWGEHKDGRLYLVMELLQGETLKERLRRSPALTESEISDLLGGVANALDHLHAKGFVHRDVKPSNIFCLANGTVKLTDMGIAQNLELAPMTRTGTVVGTPHYMAPEQISGEAGPLSDQYALAVIAFEMLTGRRPFLATEVQELHLQQMTRIAPSVREFRPDLSDLVQETLHRMLSVNPKSRFPTCEAAIAALASGLKDNYVDDATVV